MSRPVRLHASTIALVFTGGALGTAAREAIGLAVPAVRGIPVATFAINLLGALLLGLLLAGLARRGPDEGGRRQIRLLLGTGFCGGFTTYSALALDTARQLGEGATGLGLAYGLGTVILGGLATFAGISLGGLGRRTAEAEPAVPDHPGIASAERTDGDTR